MYGVGNGVLGVEVYERGELLDELLFDFEKTEEYKSLWQKYRETKDKKYSDMLWKAEREYLTKRGYFNE